MAQKKHRSSTAIDPRAYQQIVGATFANYDHRPLIVIGNRSWTRWELGRLGCPHPAAAVRINRVIKTLNITTVADFLQHAQADTFSEYKDLGVTSYWVVLALVHDLGENINKLHGEKPTFHTMHKNAMKREKPRSPRKAKGQAA
ncbi:MAG TPA: hypothetical protein VKD72_10295 [Gemmataceae bacterium]|nr:hypothetical protein [Gemmataceae bacterium]